MSENRDAEWERELAATASFRSQLRDAMATEVPPDHLDAAVLAAAHRAVGSKPVAAGRGGLRRWRVPLSAAAALVLASSLAVLFHEEGTHRRALDTGAPPMPASAVGETPTATAPAAATDPTERARREAAADSARREVESPPVLPDTERQGAVAGRSQSLPPQSPEREPTHRGDAATVEQQPERKTVAAPSPRPGPAAPAEAPPLAGNAIPSGPNVLPDDGGTTSPLAKASPPPPPVVATAASEAESADRPRSVPSPVREAAVAEAPELTEARPAAATAAASRPGSPASSALIGTEPRALANAQAVAKRRSEAPLSRPSLEEAESLWRAGRRDEARALVRRWRCIHPGEAPPAGYPIPFDEVTRCPEGAAKDASAPDR